MMDADASAALAAETANDDRATTVADGRDHQLDPRVIPLERLIGTIATAILGFGLLVAAIVNWAATDMSVPGLVIRGALWLAFAGLLAWRAYAWPAVRYRFVSYRVDDLGMEIREGVFWRVVINVPRTRVQHTDVSQGPLERRFELGTLVIYTAGTDHSRVSLSGLEHSRAMRVREHLLPGGASDAV